MADAPDALGEADQRRQPAHFSPRSTGGADTGGSGAGVKIVGSTVGWSELNALFVVGSKVG